ncbi:SRPBCC domain-containing protein [Halomonas sp. ML-15]|uniref:SRPBCC domain-containing protein n=1 Tax=Halomonas sp. ML-15 TaxID=2773305 RepID=UPI0017466DCF|nr:SRPBCC domain-containing protein [Halomonas sp. ML-15]MBD3895016.1 SRPBCC domain-containing protein [Halomonas sp. ML-15]
MGSHSLHTDIMIDARADQVWSVLSDFNAYPDWNPFIRSVIGQPVQGERLRIVVQPSGSKPMRFSPQVLVAEPLRELRWRGRMILPGIFDGEHSFTIEALSDNKVRFEQSEKFSGLLVGVLRTTLERDTKRGFEEMNQALKARVEASVHGQVD